MPLLHQNHQVKTLLSTPGAPRLNAHARAVLAALRASPCHPTAADLYAAIRPRHPQLGLATVYRALARLEASGLAVEVARDALGRHYDARTEPHDHAVCAICGGLMDVERPPVALPEPFLHAATAHGHEVSGYAIRYIGCCAVCRAATVNVKSKPGLRTLAAHPAAHDEEHTDA